MQFRFSAEHDELRAGLRRFLDQVAGPSAALRLVDDPRGHDDTVVDRLVTEFGLYALGVPERFGGAGFGITELGVVFHEAGRAALCAPLLSTTLAILLLLESGDDAVCARLMPQVASGDLSITVALAENGVPWPGLPATTASWVGDGWAVSGDKDWVLDAAVADHLVVSARIDDGVGLFLVDAGADGVTVASTPIADLTRRAGSVSLDACSATRIGDDARGALTRVADLALTLLSADQTGIAERCLEAATAWALEREQFGKPIGSFQAIKHKLADVRLELEAATSASMYALWATDKAPEELAVSARIASVVCGEAAMLAAQENIQVHGGIGATWEHPAHLYLRRAVTDRSLYGEEQQHLEQLAATL